MSRCKQTVLAKTRRQQPSSVLRTYCEKILSRTAPILCSLHTAQSYANELTRLDSKIAGLFKAASERSSECFESLPTVLRDHVAARSLHEDFEQRELHL
eukprot:4649978-Pleurochrysis_carterae.AAC.1